jgi:hypothetical protein
MDPDSTAAHKHAVARTRSGPVTQHGAPERDLDPIINTHAEPWLQNGIWRKQSPTKQHQNGIWAKLQHPPPDHSATAGSGTTLITAPSRPPAPERDPAHQSPAPSTPHGVRRAVLAQSVAARSGGVIGGRHHSALLPGLCIICAVGTTQPAAPLHREAIQ